MKARSNHAYRQMHDAGVSRMNRMLCLTIAVMAGVFASFPTSALAQVAATQFKLTAKQIEGFITAQDDILAVVQKMQDAVPSEYEAEREGHQEARIQEPCGVRHDRRHHSIVT